MGLKKLVSESITVTNVSADVVSSCFLSSYSSHRDRVSTREISSRCCCWVASGSLSRPLRQDGGRSSAPMEASVHRPDPLCKSLV